MSPREKAADKVLSWWFAASDILPHGDGRKIILGETHSIKGGKIVLCQRGLHGAEHPFDALQYAPGPYLYRVEQWGEIQRESDKLVSRHRKYLEMRELTPQLRLFAREQALSVIHLWDAPEIVHQYLETGDETLRAAASAAASAAAGDAAGAAAGAAASAAARTAARIRFHELVKEVFQ